MSRWRTYWDYFEAVVGLLATFFLAFGPFTIALGTLVFATLLAEWKVARIAATVTAVTGPMAIWLAKMSSAAFDEFRRERVLKSFLLKSSNSLNCDVPPKHPFAVWLALEVPRVPAAARVLLSIWWFAHFAAGFLLVRYFFKAWNRLDFPAVVSVVLVALSVFMFHFAANVFLVLSAGLYLNSVTALERLWRNRFLIDALCTLPVLLQLFK